MGETVIDEAVVDDPDWDDPIVEEVRKNREEMAKKYGYGNDFKLFMRFVRELEAKSTGPFVDWPMVTPKPMVYPYPGEAQEMPPMVMAEERVGYGEDK